MQTILEKLKSRTVKDSALVLFGNIISQGFSFAVFVIIGNILNTAEYGIYSVLNNISSFVTDMADMGMNGAIVKFVAELRGKGEIEKEDQLIKYSIFRKGINLIIVTIILILFSKPIAEYWLHDKKLYRYIYIVIATCCFSLFVSALKGVLQGRQEFKKYFISTVIANGAWCGIVVIMALTNKISILSSIIAQVISGALNLILCCYLVKINIRGIKQCIMIDDELKKAFNTYGIWMLLWAIFAILQSRLDVFMLATFTTSEQVSYYDVASRVIKPVLMVVSAYAQVLNPQFASMNRERLKSTVKVITKFITLVSILIVIAIVIIKPIIMMIFRDKYINSIYPAQLLLFAIVFYVWTVPFNSALYALNKPYVFTIAAFIGLIVTAIGDYYLLGDYGAVGAAYTYIAAQFVGLVVAAVAYFFTTRDKKAKSEG